MSEREKHPSTGITPNNVGWQVWNMSNRVSSVKRSARRARAVHDDPEAWRTWSTAGLLHLIGLTAELEERALDADQLWRAVQDTANGSDPGLLEPADGMSVVRNHGDDPVTMARVLAVWKAGCDRIWQAYDLAEELNRLIAAETGGDAGGLP